jgi:alpha-N-arabinofuranosidase
MKKYPFIISLYLGVAGLMALAQKTPPVPVLHIEADQIIAPVSPVFSGMMTEEINHAYDGGLYAELIQNRVFKDDATYPAHWSLVQETGAVASIALDHTNTLNEQLATSLRLDVASAAETNRAGIANDGYWGIPVKPGTSYRVSF